MGSVFSHRWVSSIGDARRILLLRLAGTALYLLSFCAAAAELLQDGPYLVAAPDGGWTARWVEGSTDASKLREQVVQIGQTIEVPAAGLAPAFRVPLRAPDPVAPVEMSLPADVQLFVVADTHGQFLILMQLLREHGVIDEHLRWSYGRGHLALLGDVFDRGPYQIEILWLIYKLEAEAAKAGGGVHLLLGNHEAMVLRGDVRYLNPKYVQMAEVLGVESYSELFGPTTLLGQWLRSKSAVLKLNNLLLLHGGISPEVVDRGLTLAQLNAAVRGTLSDDLPTPEDRARSEFVMGPSGPLWYRGYFAGESKPPLASADDIDRIGEHFGVRTILVGHTKVPTVTLLYDGKVIAVQVYPHRNEETGEAIMEAALLEDGTWYRAKIDGTREALALVRAESTTDADAVPARATPSF